MVIVDLLCMTFFYLICLAPVFNLGASEQVQRASASVSVRANVYRK